MSDSVLRRLLEQHRAIMREVALSYRRETRAAQTEGAKPPDRAYEAAHAKYMKLDPDAPPYRRAVAHRHQHDRERDPGGQPVVLARARRIGLDARCRCARRTARESEIPGPIGGYTKTPHLNPRL